MSHTNYDLFEDCAEEGAWPYPVTPTEDLNPNIVQDWLKTLDDDGLERMKERAWRATKDLCK